MKGLSERLLVLTALALLGACVPEPDARRSTPVSATPGHSTAPAKAAKRESLEDYLPRTVAGFQAKINRSLLETDPLLLARVLTALEHDLSAVESWVGEPQMEVLRQVPFWIELQGSSALGGGMPGRGMCFHVSAEWLSAHGLLAEKAGGVEIVRAADFPEWRRNQPFMTLHELAHAYHFHLGYDHPEIKAAWENAMREGLYESVPYNMAADGKPVRAYAAANQMEYFAELSEAYFGLNDYYPFTRVQLRAHDRVGYEVVKRIWALSADQIERERVRPRG